MNYLLLFLKYRILIVAGIVLFLFFSLLLFTLFNLGSNPQSSRLVYPTSVPSRRTISKTFISPLQVTEIGKPLSVKPDELSDTNIDKKTGSDGSTTYTFSSPVAARSNQIVTNEKNIVTFERVLTPEYKDEAGYARISDYVKQFGEAEKTIRGSKFYGWYVVTYIYASSGFSFIGNPNSDEIYEFHKFTPMSVADYINSYGEDLDPNAQPPRE